MEASYKRAGTVAETNYFLRLYDTFHPGKHINQFDID